MLIICKRCFEKIFEPLLEGEYKSSGTKSGCIICREQRELIEPICKMDSSGNVIRDKADDEI